VPPGARPAGRRRGRGSSSTGHCPPTPARSRMRAVWPRFVSGIERSQGRARGRRGTGGRAGGRVPSSVLPPPRTARPAAGLLRRRITNTKNERRIGASTVRRRRRSPGARPVKPAVGWYMPVGFRSGQNRATCGSWGTVRGPCADPSWSSVEQLFMRHGSISPLPPRPPFFPHYASWMSRWPRLRAGSVAHST
jgi:hypothetical protein